MGRELAKEEMKVLAALQGKNGKVGRQADPINKVILLYRLRKKLDTRKVAVTGSIFIGEV